MGRSDVDRAREAAKKLLAAQRGNLGMWAAYAGLESQARQYKVGAASSRDMSMLLTTPAILRVAMLLHPNQKERSDGLSRHLSFWLLPQRV